jgi:hypothetical protein
MTYIIFRDTFGRGLEIPPNTPPSIRSPNSSPYDASGRPKSK